MKTKKIWANLAVQDVERTRAFYTQLGFAPNGHHKAPDLASFLFGDDNFIIHFFQKEALLSNMQGTFALAKEGNEVIFSLAADSDEEVNQWAEVARKAGADIFQEPGRYGGYYFCAFADPDGHKFNVLSLEGM